MKNKLTEKQSWIVAIVLLIIVLLYTILFGFILNTPTSFEGLLSIGPSALFIILLICAFFYYRNKR